MTPFEFGILLHYFCRADDPEDTMRAPIWRGTINGFMDENLLVPNADSTRGTSYQLTDRGEFYVRAVLAMPLPVHRWEIPRGAWPPEQHDLPVESAKVLRDNLWNLYDSTPAQTTSALDYKALYHDLLMQVARKHPEETRHETARRYIQQAERGDDTLKTAAGAQATKEPSTGDRSSE